MRVHSEGERNSNTFLVVAQKRHTISFSPDSLNYHPNRARKMAERTFVSRSLDSLLSSLRKSYKVKLT
jgi:hypothetical protein